MLSGVDVLADLETAIGLRLAATESRRSVLMAVNRCVADVVAAGGVVGVRRDGADLVLRVVGLAGLSDGVVVARPAPQEFVDLADLAAVDTDTPAQEAGAPPGDRADGGGDCGVAAPVEAAADVRAVAKGSPWLAEDDALLLREVARLRADGVAFGVAYRRIAAMLPGRTADAVEFRYKTHLRPKAEGRDVPRRRRQVARAAVAPEPVPVADGPDVAPVPEAVPVAAPVAAAPVVADLPRPAAVAVKRAVRPAVAPRRLTVRPDSAPAAPGWQRDLADRLDRLAARDPLPAAVDLAIIEGKAKGTGTVALADATGLSVRVITERYHRLLPVKGHVETERLLIELRRRVALADGDAADGVAA